LHEDVGLEPKAADPEGEVELAAVLEALALLLGEHGIGDGLAILRAQRVMGPGQDLAVHPEHGRNSHRDVHVRSTLLDHELEQLVHGDRLPAGLGSSPLGHHGRFQRYWHSRRGSGLIHPWRSLQHPFRGGGLL
jgi:hypothetical protein